MFIFFRSLPLLLEPRLERESDVRIRDFMEGVLPNGTGKGTGKEKMIDILDVIDTKTTVLRNTQTSFFI